MTRVRAFLGGVLVVVAGAAAGCTIGAGAPPFTAPEIAAITALSTRSAVPPDPGNGAAAHPTAVALGKRLFFDVRLSRSGQVACATCHKPEREWADGVPSPTYVGQGLRHTPSLWNVGYNRWFFWDGRADSLWAQSLGPIESPREMGGNRTAVVRTVASDSTLRAGYEQTFGPLPSDSWIAALPSAAKPASADTEDPEHRAWSRMSEQQREAVDRVFANVGKAIASFERTLITGDTAFDRFARGLEAGDMAAQSEYPRAARRGLALFIGRAGCINCHHGGELTDREFHNIGLADDEGIFADAGRFNGILRVRSDPFNINGRFADSTAASEARKLVHLAERPDAWGEFKTPSLRNVAATAPYMHDGRFRTLEQVVDYYSTLKGGVVQGADAQHLRALNLTASERADLVAFLETLTSAR